MQFSDLPSCLVIDILSRLPITTLVTCMCVCKDWIRLFRDPYLIKLQVAASPVHILNRHIERDGIIEFGQFMEDEVKILNLPTKLDFLTLLNLPPSTSIYEYGCINSCNGLLCLVDRSNLHIATSIRVCVCNPILGEWVSISTPVRKYHDSVKYNIAIAFVFSAKMNQYKLLHCFKTEEEGEYEFEIYTLGGTRRWRSIDEPPLRCRPWLAYSYGSRRNTTFLHGSLHWISNTPQGEEFICCFDVDYEKFRRLSLPNRDEEKFYLNANMQLGVINDCLCLFFFSGCEDDVHCDELEVWTMKEYGVWGEMLTIHLSNLDLPHSLFSQNEDEILIHDNEESLVSYNFKRNTRKYWQPPQCRGEKSYNHFRVAYKPTLVSLQDVAKGEEVILSRTMQAIQ